MHFSLLNSLDIKMVPQHCSYGSAGVPAVPVTIFMSVNSLKDIQKGPMNNEPNQGVRWYKVDFTQKNYNRYISLSILVK